jgi:membrane fusion protein (multidrug efflux system)
MKFGLSAFRASRILGAAFMLPMLALAACDDSKSGNANATSAPIPVEVGVVTLRAERIAITTELPGRTNAYRIAEVRPQVGGVVLKRLFTEGAEVKAGDQLYQIDPATYQASYDSAKATLARAEATLTSARLLAERYKPLVAVNAVSRQDYDNAVASQAQAQADVASAKAALESARINLVYTKVQSPISGRIGRSGITEGALVTANQTTALATVQQLDPIYVDVTQSSADLIRLKRDLASGKLKGADADHANVRLILEDGSSYPETGVLQFSEVTVNTGTGSVTLRAVFPNGQKLLLPGMFVHAILEEGVDERAILVPQEGIGRDQRGQPTALVVNAEGKVELRVVKTDRTIGNRWLVTEGLLVGDKVIVQGLQKVRPGAQVRVAEASAAITPPAAQR